MNRLPSELGKRAATPRRFFWRRLLQYRLRTLLIVTTVIAVWLGWWSYKARQQREAVAAVTTAGGAVFYDFEQHDLDEPPYWPKWLVGAMGVDYFGDVNVIDLSGTEIADADLIKLCHLASLEFIVLNNTQISDAGLENLKGLNRLTGVHLVNTRTTPAGRQRLQRALPNCMINSTRDD